jgi:hypothetical protein
MLTFLPAVLQISCSWGGGGAAVSRGGIAQGTVILDTKYLFDKNYIRLYYFETEQNNFLKKPI